MEAILDQIAADVAETLHWEFSLAMPGELVDLDTLEWRTSRHTRFAGPYWFDTATGPKQFYRVL